MIRNLCMLALAATIGTACQQTTKNPAEQSTGDSTSTTRSIWTPDQANQWYAKQGWLVGANYITGSAINQLEMWQAETFDTAAIDKELALAESIGMNTMRVFMHDLLYTQDPKGILDRMDTFLGIAAKHKIRIMFVLFDSVWDPFPALGKQRDPKPGVHNSGWVQSPGLNVLKDSVAFDKLEPFVTETIKRFANDERVVVWDIWNEPDNPNESAYGKVELKGKPEFVLPKLKKAFEWARAANPSQPITAGVWWGDLSAPEKLSPIAKLMIDQSDVVSFHTYDDTTKVRQRIANLQVYGKPLICTEYMARPQKNTFQAIMPIFKEHNVAAYNWGFIEGKSQTNYPWDSWKKAYTSEPKPWFHDIFRKNGEPYDKAETEFIKGITAQQ